MGYRVIRFDQRGSDDDVVPIEHGRRLVASIPDATHLWIYGVGHVFPYPESAAAKSEILAHLDSASRELGGGSRVTRRPPAAAILPLSAGEKAPHLPPMLFLTEC